MGAGELASETGFAKAALLGRLAGVVAMAKRQVVIADSAKWIWNATAELFPNAICVVDIWHAKDRLWEVGRSVCGAGTELCRAWSEKVCAALSERRVDDMLRELRRHAGDKTADQIAPHCRYLSTLPSQACVRARAPPLRFPKQPRGVP